MAATVRPSVELRGLFAALADDYARHDPVVGSMYTEGLRDFPRYVGNLLDEEQSLGLPSDRVGCTHRWIVDGQAIVGVVRIRHSLGTPYLAEEAGHIGYDVPPSHRRRGYGTVALSAGLTEAGILGLGRVLVCADSDNVASWKVIGRCGGVLECEKMSAHYGKPFRRYWIQLNEARPTASSTRGRKPRRA